MAKRGYNNILNLICSISVRIVFAAASAGPVFNTAIFGAGGLNSRSLVENMAKCRVLNMEAIQLFAALRAVSENYTA